MLLMWLLPLFLSYAGLEVASVPVSCNITANCLFFGGDVCLKNLNKPGKHDLQVVKNKNKRVWCDQDQDCLCYRQKPDKPAVLITGGAAPGVSNLVELYPSYCPPMGPLPEGRYRHVSFQTNSKTLATCGGHLGGSGLTDTCIVFDKSGSPQWGTNVGVMGNLIEKRKDSTAVTMGDGVYLLGGSTDGTDVRSTTNTSELLKNGESTWQSGPDIPGIGSRYSCSVAISTFSFLLIGGGDTGHTSPGGNAEVWEYHTPTMSGSSGQWIQWNNLNTGRGGHRCAKLRNRVVVAGGVDSSNSPISSTEIIDLGTGAVIPGNPLPNNLLDFGMVTVGTKFQNIIAFGGATNFSPNSVTPAVHIWDDVTVSWLPMLPSLLAGNRDPGFIAIEKKQVC